MCWYSSVSGMREGAAGRRRCRRQDDGNDGIEGNNLKVVRSSFGRSSVSLGGIIAIAMGGDAAKFLFLRDGLLTHLPQCRRRLRKKEYLDGRLP